MSHRHDGADPDPRLIRIAEAIAEGWTVDWTWEERAHTDDGLFVERLRLLRSIVTATSCRDEGANGVQGEDEIGVWGRLRIRAKLGEGAFGEVYRAYDPLLDREVALKLARTSDSSHEERLVLEARRLARIRHPNVLVVHGADVLQGRVGIWSDLLHGRTLADHLAAEGPLSAREASSIGVDLCRALTAVHKEGIVHRDLKASNVMREPEGRVVLMDFGSGGELLEDPSGNVYGTPLLMAPEQLRGEPVGAQADIYSLGVLLYHAVSAEYPISASSLSELRERHLKAELVPLRARKPDLPGDFVQIVDRSIHPDPKYRFPTARAMEQELSACIGSSQETRRSGSAEEAHQSYLMARYFMDRGTREAALKAIEYLKRAVEADPKFALGWVELSRAYSFEADSSTASGAREPAGRGWLEEARRAVKQALVLDPGLVEGHVRMGLIQARYDLDWRGAEASMARALELAPRNPRALRGAAMVARILGRVDKAIELYSAALKEEPLSAATYQHLGIALESLDRVVDAEAAFRRSLDLAPQKVITRALLSLTLLALDRMEEAFAEAELEPDDLFRLWATTIILANGKWCSAPTGELVDKYGDGAPFQIAEVFAVVGELDLAFKWLEKARILRDSGLTEMKTSPRLRSLHRDRRWMPMLKKVGLAG